MFKSIGFCDFCDEFNKSDRKENFSYEGKKALFQYLENYEDETGEEQELDIVSLCCDYSEYKTLKELQKDYNVESMEELEENTIVIYFDEGFIIQQF